MRLLVISDLDDLHWREGSGCVDVVVACGDVAECTILEAAEAYGCAIVLAVKGNHDTRLPFHEPVVDLHLRTVEHNGVVFGGLNGSWKYKPRGHYLYEQWEVETMLAQFPPVDVLISHNSPRRVHDQDDDVHIGFDALHGYIERARPRLVIHGHQHVNRETRVGETRVIGVYGRRIVEIETT